MVHLILLLSIIFGLLLRVTSTTIEDVNEEIGLSTMEIITKFGYPLEVHTVQTDDGYLLDVHRIPHGKNRKSLKNTSPVLIYAGIQTDSSSYVSLGSNKSLAFVLADLGYDVWLGNTRGTTHCRKHVTLDPYRDKKQFWDFSFQEMGFYDLPATIDYVLKKTKQKKLSFIGYSQSTTSVFAMLAEKLTYNKKIRLLIVLAPILGLQHSHGPLIQLLASEMDFVWSTVNKYQIFDILPLTDKVKEFRLPFCSYNSSTQDLCLFLFCRFLPASCAQVDRARLPVILSNMPSGGSFKEVQHFFQLRHGIFQKYDYGRSKNLQLYHNEMPPIYNLSNIQVPTAIFYSKEDNLASYHDAETVMKKLPNIVYKKILPDDFNHIDILLGVDIHKFVNEDVAKLLKYSRQYKND